MSRVFLMLTLPLALAGGCFVPAFAAAMQKPVLRFERNDGQTDAPARYVARGAGYRIFFTNRDAVISTGVANGSPILRIRPIGANSKAEVIGEGMLESRSHYILGESSEKWIRNVPHYSRVLYRGIYDGIDLAYYGTEQDLEYDFLIAAGANPHVIRLRLDGAKALRIDARGDLRFVAGGRELVQRRPIGYQVIRGARRDVTVEYRIARGAVSFRVGSYDRGHRLIIDPLLKYATYAGGSGEDRVNDIAIDLFGFVYVGGTTKSMNFPVANARQPANAGGTSDAFLAKYSRDGSTLVFSTYFGGSGKDEIAGVAVNASSIYVTGLTTSADLPTTPGAFRTTRPSSGLFEDVFVTRFPRDGMSLGYSTYIGHGVVRDVAADTAGSAYITGRGTPGSYPTTTGAYDAGSPFGDSDAFVTKIHPNGIGLVYSTFIGGHLGTPNNSGAHLDEGKAIAVDKSGFAYIAGYTISHRFPVVAAFQATPGGSGFPDFEATHDAFVTKVNTTGTGLLYSSFLGGSRSEEAYAAALDEDGNFYVAGRSGESPNFPVTANPYATSGRGFVTKVSGSGSSLVYSTMFPEIIYELAQHEGYTYLAGSTSSATFPVLDAQQATLAGGVDAYLSVLNAHGSALAYSTYFGGSGDETIDDKTGALAVDSSASVFFGGLTASTNFPTQNAVQSVAGGSGDGFLVKIGFDADGDGLLDRWEGSGIDINHDGTVDLNLAALGANKNHKDIFVEIDYMVDANHTHHPERHPSGAALLATNPIQEAINAFAAAPVSNPDGQAGISLHVTVDEPITEITSMTFNGASSDFNTIKHGAPSNPCGAGHFGSPADRSSTNCAQILKARRRVYRYALFAHEYASAPRASGVAEMPGNDLIVSLPVGVPGPNNGFDDTATTLAGSFGTAFDDEFADGMAGTFMHELGHTLGLDHGGGTGLTNQAAGIHRKPNYLSVMNYSFQMNSHARDAANPAVVLRTNRPLDYSDTVLPELNEHALNETVGIAGPQGRFTLYGMGQTGLPRIATAQGPIDWNGTNGIEAFIG